MSVPAVLGIDGGGSSTIAWLGDQRGGVIGRGRAGPSNAKAVGAPAARQALADAIDQSFVNANLRAGPVRVACLGLAGFDRPEDKQLLTEWSAAAQWAQRLVLVNDGDLVLAAGTPAGWGLAIIAGTGSIAVGRTQEGKTARAGGWGHIMGDEGSAYGVAVTALRMIARWADGRDSSRVGEVLARRLCPALGIANASSLVTAVYAPETDRTRIAALAPAVLQAAEDDPGVIEVLLRPAALELAEQLIAVANRLGWRPVAPDSTSPRLPLAMAGGFLLAAPSLAAAIIETLERGGFPVDATAVPEPVRGAIVLACKALAE